MACSTRDRLADFDGQHGFVNQPVDQIDGDTEEDKRPAGLAGVVPEPGGGPRAVSRAGGARRPLN